MKRFIKMAFLGTVAATVILGASAAFAEGTTKVDTNGIAFQVPEQLSDLVNVQTENLGEDTLVSVFEKASVEASEKLGENHDGAGWIFSITKVPEQKMKELRCGGMDGMDVFAEDDDFFYVYNHPTDVRIVREAQEDYQAGLEQWTMINEWAGQEVRQEILANNPDLDEEFFTNTSLDMHLAQAAFKPGTKFELRSLDFGAEALDPAALKEDDFIEDLANDVTYEVLPDAQSPDGEYVVLAFDDNGEEVRYDFFKAEGARNLIRETRKVGDEEYTTIYQANFKDADDADKTTTGIVEEWCKEIAAVSGR